MTIPTSFSPLSLIAFRVPPIQFTASAGNPKKLITTDIMSGCGTAGFPKSISDIIKLLHNGTALTINSVMTTISASIAGITGTLNTFISQAAGGLLTDLQALRSAITGSDFTDLSQAVNSTASNVVNTAGAITSLNQMSLGLGLPEIPSASTIFSGIVGGSLNTALTGAGLDTATNNIVSTLNAAIGNVTSLTGLIAPLTSAFNTAVTAALATVNTAIAGVATSIDRALSGLMGSIASASSIAGGMLCAEMTAFSSFVNSIATPALKAILPVPGS